MKKNQGLNELTLNILTNIKTVLENFRPDIVLVHGDTTTTFAASLAAYYQQIKIGHVEAGLRTGNLYSPYPEEANRKLTSVLADYHFAPTLIAKENLLNEGIAEEKITITGNTVMIIHSGLFFDNMNDSISFNLFVIFVFLSSDLVSVKSIFN